MIYALRFDAPRRIFTIDRCDATYAYAGTVAFYKYYDGSLSCKMQKDIKDFDSFVVFETEDQAVASSVHRAYCARDARDFLNTFDYHSLSDEAACAVKSYILTMQKQDSSYLYMAHG